MAPSSQPQRPGGTALAFIAVGLGWLGVAAAMLVAHPGSLLQPHVAPAVVALTHAWVLGFFVTAAVGAVYQIAPLALGTALWSGRLAWIHFALQCAAVPGMVWGFARWNLPVVVGFGTAAAAGTALFALNLVQTFRRSRRRDAVSWSIALSGCWLLATALAGLLVAANRAWIFLPVDSLRLLRVHAHLGLAGFFLTLMQGVTFQIVPMFAIGEVRDWRTVGAGLWTTQAGLLGLAPALAAGAGYFVAGFGATILAGILLSGWAFQQAIATRGNRPLGVAIQVLLLGSAVLVPAAALGILLALPRTPWGSSPGGPGATVYGVAVIIGGLLPIFAGTLCRIVPVLTWLRAYGPKAGRGAPPPGTLSSPRIEAWGFGFQGLGLAGLFVGAWLLDARALLAGALALAAGSGLFLAAMTRVLCHLRWPCRPTAQ